MGGFFGNQWHEITTMRVLTVLATMSIVVTAVYVLRGLGTVFLGPINDKHHEELTDATFTEKLTTGILILTMLVVGIYPKIIVDMIEPAIYPIINRLHM
jgi:NADH-quinone oxidoreductase subunit M